MFTEAEGPKATPRQPTGLHESQTGSQPTIKLAEDSATHAGEPVSSNCSNCHLNIE